MYLCKSGKSDKSCFSMNFVADIAIEAIRERPAITSHNARVSGSIIRVRACWIKPQQSHYTYQNPILSERQTQHGGNQTMPSHSQSSSTNHPFEETYPRVFHCRGGEGNTAIDKTADSPKIDCSIPNLAKWNLCNFYIGKLNQGLIRTGRFFDLLTLAPL